MLRIGKEEVKVSLFADDVIVYVINPQNFIIELVQLINKFRKVTGYKVNSNKSVTFLYTNDKQAEKEISETTPFTIITNSKKYISITLTEQMKSLYDKNVRFLKKEVEDLRRWKYLLC